MEVIELLQSVCGAFALVVAVMLGTVFVIVALAWALVYSTAWMLDSITKMIGVHRAVFRFIWYGYEFRQWYLKKAKAQRELRAKYRGWKVDDK